MNKKLMTRFSGFVAAALASYALWSCSDENGLEPVAEVPDGTFPVTVTFKGAAAGQDATRATTTAADADEKKMTHLDAVIFERQDDGFGKLYKVMSLDSILGGENVTFNVGKAGVFDMWFVANAETALKTKLQALVPGTSTPEDFGKIVADQQPAPGNFLMVSVYDSEIRVAPGVQNKATVTMQRAVARFDIINHTTEFDITKLTVRNAGVKSTLLSGAVPETSEGMGGTNPAARMTDVSETAVSVPKNTFDKSSSTWTNDGDGDGSSVKKKAAYVYENLDETKPVELYLEYKDANGVVQSINVPFVDEDSKQLPLNRNYRYIVTMTKTDENAALKVKVAVADWNESGELNVEGEKLQVEPLYVANLFEGHGISSVTPGLTPDDVLAGKWADSYEFKLDYNNTLKPLCEFQLPAYTEIEMINKDVTLKLANNVDAAMAPRRITPGGITTGSSTTTAEMETFLPDKNMSSLILMANDAVYAAVFEKFITGGARVTEGTENLTIDVAYEIVKTIDGVDKAQEWSSTESKSRAGIIIMAKEKCKVPLTGGYHIWYDATDNCVYMTRFEGNNSQCCAYKIELKGVVFNENNGSFSDLEDFRKAPRKKIAPGAMTSPFEDGKTYMLKMSICKLPEAVTADNFTDTNFSTTNTKIKGYFASQKCYEFSYPFLNNTVYVGNGQSFVPILQPVGKVGVTGNHIKNTTADPLNVNLYFMIPGVVNEEIHHKVGLIN